MWQRELVYVLVQISFPGFQTEIQWGHVTWLTSLSGSCWTWTRTQIYKCLCKSLSITSHLIILCFSPYSPFLKAFIFCLPPYQNTDSNYTKLRCAISFILLISLKANSCSQATWLCSYEERWTSQNRSFITSLFWVLVLMITNPFCCGSLQSILHTAAPTPAAWGHFLQTMFPCFPLSG